MAIKKARKIQRISLEKPVSKPTQKTQAEQLPPDEYEDEIPAKEVVLDDEVKFVVSVKRMGEFGLPYVDVRTYVSNKRFTGFTKKGVTFPLETLIEMISTLQEAFDECERKGLIE